MVSTLILFTYGLITAMCTASPACGLILLCAFGLALLKVANPDLNGSINVKNEKTGPVIATSILNQQKHEIFGLGLTRNYFQNVLTMLLYSF